MGNEENAAPIRLLIADDHALVRRGLRSMLEQEPDFEIVGEAGDGRAAVELCRSLVPDIVLMDVRMPGMDGLSATSTIKKERPEIEVVMVTMQENRAYIRKALQIGAAGYVLKDATQAELIEAVRHAMRRE
jgi:DNA-binding NarL/FixJ family response regulator